MDLKNNKYYREALRFIADNDLTALQPGRHVIDGDNLFVNIVECSLKKPWEARLEVHNAYIDIQVPLSGPESYGVKPRGCALGAEGTFDEEKDIQFYSDKQWDTVTAGPGQPVTFDPDTAHAPLIGEGTIRKAIFKVRVS